MSPDRDGIDTQAQELLRAVEMVNPPMPLDADSDSFWDSWMSVQSIQGILVGLVGQLVGQGAANDEQGLLEVAAADLADPGVRALMGVHAEDGDRLIALLRSRLHQ